MSGSRDRDLTELLDALVWAHRIVEPECGGTYVFRPLTLEERNMANFVFEQANRNGAKYGRKTQKELTKIVTKSGHWKESNDDAIKLLREELSLRVRDLSIEEKENMLDSKGRSRRKGPTSKYIKLERRVGYLSSSIKSLEDKRVQLIELPSVEYAAELERGTYSLWCATLTFPDMKPLWETYEDLLQEEDKNLVMQLTNAFYKATLASESEIRSLARSPAWRIQWMHAKKNRGVRTLFGREMFDITMDQFRLVYWSQIYDSAYESMETPSDEVFEDDNLFDRWLDEQSEKRKREKKQSEFDKKVNRTKKGTDGHEVGFDINGYYCEECTCGVSHMEKPLGHLHAPSCPHGVFIYYNEDIRTEKIEEIQSTNPEGVRRVLAKEQKSLAEGGHSVEEQHLRNDAKSRAVFGMPTRTIGPDDSGKQGRA